MELFLYPFICTHYQEANSIKPHHFPIQFFSRIQFMLLQCSVLSPCLSIDTRLSETRYPIVITRQSNKLVFIFLGYGCNHQESDNDKNETLLSSQEMIEERRITEKAVLNTCKVITGLQMISWLPILVMDSSEMVRPSLPYRKLVVAICISNILSAIGHISDPLVCIFLLKNFKQSIKYLFVRNITQEL